MKKIFFILLLISTLQEIFAQNVFNRFYQNQIKYSNIETPLKLNVSISPFFFLEKGGFGVGSAVEFKRFQVGLNYVAYEKMPENFKNGLFKNATQINATNTSAIEFVANLYLRKDRKGFYLGFLSNYFRATLNDDIKKISESSFSTNVDLLAGFRWFPFREYFYVDAAYGFSKLATASTSKNNIYTYDPKLKWFPFVNIGARFPLKK